jgi:hypothetical protein
MSIVEWQCYVNAHNCQRKAQQSPTTKSPTAVALMCKFQKMRFVLLVAVLLAVTLVRVTEQINSLSQYLTKHTHLLQSDAFVVVRLAILKSAFLFVFLEIIFFGPLQPAFNQTAYRYPSYTGGSQRPMFWNPYQFPGLFHFC